MIDTRALSINKISLSAEGRFCQETRHRIGHYDHFHSPMN